MKSYSITLLDTADGKPVDGAHVWASNMAGTRNGAGTVSDQNGRAFLWADENQFITVSHVGYKPKVLRLVGQPISFSVPMVNNELDEVVIKPGPDAGNKNMQKAAWLIVVLGLLAAANS